MVFAIILWSVVLFGIIDVITPKETSHIAYGIFVYVFVCIIFIWPDFLRYMKKCRKMQVIFDHVGSVPVDFGGAQDLPEQYYQMMIEKLLHQTAQSLERLGQDYNEHTEYYSMWVHQIKTPISALRLMIQSDDCIANKGDYYAEIFRIEQYVEMVLGYMRLKNMAEDTVIDKIDVYNVVRESVKKFSSVFISKHLSVDILYFDRLVYTDAKWLAFLIEQFISNSVKYTNKGTVRIFGKSLDKQWVLYIKDEGIGIRSEDIPRIFEKGYTGYNGRIYKKSTGIGLYLAKSAADRLGLKLEVISEVGKGTAVKIIFSEDILC